MNIHKIFYLAVIFFYFHSSIYSMRCFIQHIENNTSQQINLTQITAGETDRLLSIDALATMILPPEESITLPYSISKYTRKMTQVKLTIAVRDELTEIVYDFYYTVRVLNDNSSLAMVYLNSDCLTIEVSSSRLFGTEKIPTLNIPLKLIITETLRFKLEQLSATPSSPSDRSSADS